MNQCIVNQKEGICTHKKLSGKPCCSTCKRSYAAMESVKWYHYFCINVPNYKDLSMDEQGHLVVKAMECYDKCHGRIDEFDNSSDANRRKLVCLLLDIPM